MEIGNFVCRFGEEQVLLDHYESLVEPAFMSGFERTYGETTYLLMDVKLVDAGTPDGAVPALAGRFVKDTVLHQQQRLVDGQLEAAEQTFDSAPSSLFVLTLTGHRLLFVREHRGSPDMGQFATTIERFINRARRELIDRSYLEAKASADKVTKKALGITYPKAEVTVTPVLADESIEEFLKRFSVLTTVSVKLQPTNEEPDYNDFFKQLREQKEAVGADKTKLEFKGSKSDGLNVEATADQLKAAKDGNAEFVLKGTDQSGRDLKGDNEHFKVRVPVEMDRPSTSDAANRMGSAFRSLVDEGEVRPGEAPDHHQAVILGLVARLRR
jgi:hypothetical protein